MGCVTPMFREYIEYTPEQKQKMKDQGIKQWQRIVPRQEVMSYLYQNPFAIRELDDINESFIASGSSHRIQKIPCRNCWACKLKYSAEWAERICCEIKEHPDHNYWLTLTYDDDHLPIADYIDYKSYFPKGQRPETAEHNYEIKRTYNTGEESWIEGTLFPEHVHTFLNSLRKYFERKGHTGIKFFYAGEYGELNHRPHYHIVLLNCPLSIDEFYDFHVEDFKPRWKTCQLDRLWKKGVVEVSELEFSNAAYTARYSMKKLIDGSKTDEQYAEQGKIKEYIRMSRRPGIGMTFLENNFEQIYTEDGLAMKTVKGHTSIIKPPAAWDRKLKEKNESWYEQIKETRKRAAERSEKLQREISTYSDLERLRMKADAIQIKGKQLKREL